MKTMSRSNPTIRIEEIISRINEFETKKAKVIKAAIAALLIFAWTVSLLIPRGFVFAQSISTVPAVTKSSGVVERLGDLSVSRGRTPITPSPRSSSSSEVSQLSLTSLNDKVALKREEGLLQKSLTGVRPRPLEVSQARVVKGATPPVSIPQKLDVLAQALIDENVKGLQALKMDEFMNAYLVAVGMELSAWMEDSGKENYFQDLFKIQGPWVLVFLAMSPTSMHEYMADLELPSTAGDITEAKKLPINMTVEKKGGDVIIEAQGAYDLWITFRVSAQNEVSVIVGE